MIVWLQDSNKFVYYTGSAWTDVIVPPSTGNAIINGAFDIWQRGTSFTPAAGGAEVYTADRFATQRDGTGATVTVSQQTFTPGTAPVSGYEGQYFIRFAQSVAGTGGTYNQLWQRVEDVRTYAGQTVTYSFWAKAAAASTIQQLTIQQFGSGGSADALTYGTTHNITTSWARYSSTFTMPSVSGKTIGAGSRVQMSMLFPNNTAQTIDIWGVQLEASSTATAFKTHTGDVGLEKIACQRYLPVWEGGPIAGYAYATNSAFYSYKFPVSARTAPTSITVVTNASAYSLNSPTTVTPTIDNSNVDGASLLASLTITAGQGSRLWNGRILFNGCEL
jgi:hypothetical protein